MGNHHSDIRKLVLFVPFLIIACHNTETNQHPDLPAQKNIDSTTSSVPDIEKLNFSDTIQLKAGENMHFDKELFRVRANKKIKLLFTNTSKKSPMSMTHNVVILSKGTDIADFADVAHLAKNEGYVPASVSSLVIAHTKMVGGGDSDQIEFTIKQTGVYDFICSFPGHWGTMQGKIVVQ